MPSSVNVEICNFREVDFSAALLQLVKDHTWYCLQLRVLDSPNEGLLTIFECIFPQRVPVLSFVHLHTLRFVGLAFRQPLSPSGAPRLETAQLDCLRPLTMHVCTPVFGSVTSLRLMCLWI